MQRTQIYLEDHMIAELKNVAERLNITMSEFIRGAVKKELQNYEQKSLSQFVDTLQPLESFKNKDAIAYVDELRSKSRIVQ